MLMPKRKDTPFSDLGISILSMQLCALTLFKVVTVPESPLRSFLQCYTNHNVHVVRKESRKVKLAVIGGDGIGPEVTAEALKVLNTVRNDIATKTASSSPTQTLLPSVSTMPSCWVPSARPAMCRPAYSNAVFC